MLPDERQLVGMEAPAEAATAAPAVPRSEAEQVDAGQICSQYHNVTDAMNAAWPGGEARARFRRAVAGLLLRSQRKCQRPHTMTNADLGEEVRDQHQQLVAQLLPDGGKLKFSKLLLRQPDEAGAGTTPEFFVMEQVGGAPGVRLELKQLLGWWKGGQEQHCVTGAWDEDSTTAGGDQDAHAPGTSVPAAAIEQDAIAVQPTAVYAPAQAAAELAVAAMGLEPMGVGTKPAASTGGAPIPQTSNQNTHVAGVQEQEMGNHGAGGTGTVSPVHGASDTTAQEEQLAAAAAWPGEGPQAQLRRAAAALLLQRRTWGPQGPHSLQQAALCKELCQRHPDLVEPLAPPGGKLRLKDVLPRQSANPDDRDPDSHPEPRVTQGQGQGQGQGAHADEESWEQLYAEDSNGSWGSEIAAAGEQGAARGAEADAGAGTGARQQRADEGAGDACRLLPEFFVLSNTAKGEPVVRLDRAAMLRWWRQRAGAHGGSGRASSSRDVGAAAAMEPPAPTQGAAASAAAQPVVGPEAAPVQLRPSAATAPCATGPPCVQPGRAGAGSPDGEGTDQAQDRALDEDRAQGGANAGGGVWGEGGGGGKVPVSRPSDAADGCTPRGEGGGAQGGAQGDAVGATTSTQPAAPADCGHAAAVPGAVQGPSPSPSPSPSQPDEELDFGALTDGHSNPLQDLVATLVFAATHRGDAAAVAAAGRWGHCTSEVQALAAALPGDSPLARLQRRTAALLLLPPPPPTLSTYRGQTPLGAHTLTATDLGAQLRRLYPALVAEVLGPTGKLRIMQLLRRQTAAPDPSAHPVSALASALASEPPEVFTLISADPQAPTVRLELQRVTEWWSSSGGGGNAAGRGASDSAAADGDGAVQLGGGGGGAAPADAAPADIPRGTPFPASGAACLAAPHAPHLPSLATPSSASHAELHGQPPASIPAHDMKPSPPPAGPSADNALLTAPTETGTQLKKAALKIGAHAPADDILGAVAAALPGSDMAATIRRWCALLLLSLCPGEYQGPLGPHSMAAAALASALVSAFPGVCHKQYVSGTDDNGLQLTKLLRDAHRTAAGQLSGGADAAGSWRRHEAAPGEGLQAHPPVPQIFIVRLEPPEQAAVRLNVYALMKWWSKVGPAAAAAGTSAAGPNAAVASSADNGSGIGSAAPGQGAGRGVQAGLRPQVAGSASPESWRHGADATRSRPNPHPTTQPQLQQLQQQHQRGSASSFESPETGVLPPAAQPPSRITSMASPPAPSVVSPTPIPPGPLPPAVHAQSSQAAAASDSHAPVSSEGYPGASAACKLEEEPLYLGPQRQGHARASLTAISGVEGTAVGGGGGGAGAGGGALGAGGGGAVRGGGGKSGTGPSRQSAGEDLRHLERRTREVDVAWQKVCRARGHEGLLMPPGLAAACATAWGGGGYVSTLRRAVAVLLLVPPPRVEGGGAAGREAEELGPFTLYEDTVESEVADFFPFIVSKMEASGKRHPLRCLLNDKSAAGDASHRQHGQQHPHEEPLDDEPDRAACDEEEMVPPRLFAVLEGPTGHLAVRLHLMALQQWWAARNHTHPTAHSSHPGRLVVSAGSSASLLPLLGRSEAGLWVDALRGRHSHPVRPPSGGPPYAHTSFSSGEGGLGAVGGLRVAVRWHRSATGIARGVVAQGFGFQCDEGGGAGAEFVDTRLCIREVQLHRGLERCGGDAVQAAAIAAAWRGGGPAAQLARRLAAMLSQPPPAAQGPAGPCSMSKAALCSELRAMYPELVAELLLLSPPQPPQSTPASQQSPLSSLAPAADNAGGWGHTGDLPLERLLLLLPACPAPSGTGHAVTAEAARPPFFSFVECGQGQVAVRLEAEALGLRCDGEGAMEEHQQQHQDRDLAQEGGSGMSSGAAGLAVGGADAPAGSATSSGSMLGRSGGGAPPAACQQPLLPAPRPHSVLLLQPMDVGAPPWPGASAACGPGAPLEHPMHPLTGAPASAASTQLGRRAPEQQVQQQREGLGAPAHAPVHGVQPVQGVPLRLLPLWAFPGSAPDSCLRRDLAGRLVPLAERAAEAGMFLLQLLTLPVPLAADAHPARSSPAALVAFLTHPDSRGAFRLSQDCGSIGGRRNGVIVALDLEPLRTAAARGLAEAVAAAWPGEGPLPRLRRAAAELLARAVGPAAGPAGEHSMSGTALCNALSRQLGEGFKEAVGSVTGMQLLTALADGGNGLGFIMCDTQAGPQGVAKLRLDALLRSLPCPAAAVGGGNAGAAAADSSVAAGARPTPEERHLQPPPPPPPQAQQGHAASASSSGPIAGPRRRFVDAAGPSLSSSTNTARVPGPAAATASAGGAATATGPDVVVQRLPLGLLPPMAFPGTAPGQVLRRGCAERLAGPQGEQRGPLSLSVLIKLLDKGALSPLGPQPSPTSLAALLTHPDSGGVFQLYHDVSHHSSSNFSVELVVQALRRKAARGLVEAVAAAWPGEAPLPRLRRAAALAMACEYDGGPGTPSGNRHVSGEVLAGRLREQLGEEAVPHPVELPQRLSKGDETKLFVVEKRKGVPWACLRLGKLLQDWPQDGTVAGGAAAAAAAAVGARAAGAAEGVADPLLATHVPRPGRGTELLASARAPSPSSALPQQQQLQLQLQPSAVPPPGLSAGGDSGVQEVPLRLLPLWAFPGSAPDSCLRRNVAGRAARDAAVQPQLPLKELMGLKLADRAAAAALSSHRSVASLAAFLTHPDSRGVFTCDMPHGTVTVNPDALRLAAGRGLAEAVAAAWPGEGPLPRLRRAAAGVLARVMCEYAGPGGRHCATGEALCAALAAQMDPWEVPPAEELPLVLAQEDPAGVLMVHNLQGVLWARLRLAVLLQAWPQHGAPAAAPASLGGPEAAGTRGPTPATPMASGARGPDPSPSPSSSSPQTVPATQQPQQPQQHPEQHNDLLRHHPTQHILHPYLHQLLLPPHLVQSLPEPTTVFVDWTGARHVTGCAPDASSSASSSHNPASAPALGPAHSSWQDALSLLLTHSRAATQVGVAVMRVAGAPALVALYVPPAAAPAAPVPIEGVLTAGQAAGAGAGAAAVEASGSSRVLGATVYVLDMAVPHPDSAEAAAAEAEAAAADGAGQGPGEGRAAGGPAAYTCAVVEALRGVLQDGRVAKVVHGAQQVDTLEAACDALRSEPLLDTRQVLEAMLLGPFFPNLPSPPPPPPAAPHAHPHSHLLPTARMAEALHASRLRAHVEGFRRALGGTGLWADRPQLLELLAARQLAALGDEHDAAAGRDRVWAARPLPPERVLGAAQRAVHLTELWAALAHEALPWAAMHAAAQAAERRRAERAAAAAAAVAAAADASEMAP